MPEYVTIQERVERRTYLKGWFIGKFLGYLDFPNSDIKTENFYDLEVLSGEIKTEKSNFRIWKEGDEFEEFVEVERFLTKLPDSLPCEISYEDGSVKHFVVNLNEAKLVNYRLINKLYESEKLFATIEGEISGYLKHYDIEEKQIEVIPPEPTIDDGTKTLETPDNDFSIKAGGIKDSINSGGIGKTRANNYTGNWNYKNNYFRTNWNWLIDGCSSIIRILFVVFLILIVFLYLAAGIVSVFRVASTIIANFITSVVFPLLIVGSILFLFVKVQHRLSRTWKWIFRLIIVLLIFFLCLNGLLN